MYLVFDIGGTAIKYCWMNEAGEIFNKQEILSTAVDSLDKFIETVAKIYHESNRKVEGIALSCPGVIDAANGTIKVVVAYPYLQGICLTELISKACDNIKVSLENDAKCAGLAEAWIGSAQAYDDAIIVVLGTGIGGAIIKNKQIHHGAHLFALCKRAAEALAVTSIDGRRVFELANNADEVVLEVLKNFCLDIAIQLYNLQYSYDPGVICIGGGISKQPLLIKLIKEAVEIIANETNQLLKPNVTTCKFYNEANLIGALSYFLSIK